MTFVYGDRPEDTLVYKIGFAYGFVTRRVLRIIKAIPRLFMAGLLTICRTLFFIFLFLGFLLMGLPFWLIVFFIL